MQRNIHTSVVATPTQWDQGCFASQFHTKGLWNACWSTQTNSWENFQSNRKTAHCQSENVKRSNVGTPIHVVQLRISDSFHWCEKAFTRWPDHRPFAVQENRKKNCRILLRKNKTTPQNIFFSFGRDARFTIHNATWKKIIKFSCTF